MKANSLEELVTNSNIAGELRNYTDWHTRLVKFAQLVADWQKQQMLKDAVEGETEKDLGWISVKDRLPEKNGWYFTCVEQFKIPQCVGITYFDKEGGWWLNDIPMTERIFVSTIEIVDYWMEIPALPEED